MKAVPEIITAGRKAVAGHVLPYLVWIAFIAAFQLGDSLGLPISGGCAPVAYAVKSLLCLALLAWLKPWRCYAPCLSSARCLGDVAAGIGAGLLVAALWILPETEFAMSHFRHLVLAYRKWCVMPLGEWPSYFAPQIFPSIPDGSACLAYSPAEAGWPLALVRLAGSAFVIAIAEEYFFRGFLYRWMRSRDWLKTPLSAFDAQSFWVVCLLFAFEHDRWLVGLLAGICFGLLAISRGGMRSAVWAHITANFVLGAYVLAMGRYDFW